jgi:hypothetical protein
MTRLALLAAAALVSTLPACAIEGDLQWDVPHVSADVYDDGLEVRVLACNEAVAFGCNAEAPDASLSITVDGATFSSQTTHSDPQQDEIMSLFTTGTLRVAGPSPSDRILDLALAPSGYAARVVLPELPTITDPGTVARGDGPITLHYDARPDASMTIAIVTIDCPGTTMDGGATRDVPVPGAFEVDLAALTASTATCAVEVQIDQAVPAEGARVMTIARTTFVTTP